MTLDEFRKNFPPNAKIPQQLIKLLEYQNQAQGWYAGCFELIDYGKEALLSWFDNEAAANQFIQFGSGPDGSLLCFWLYDGRSIEVAPIVFLGSEGVNNTVLTNTIEEFLALLGIGYDEIGFADWSRGPEEEAEGIKEFRAWLKKEFGIKPPERGKELIEQAKANHPDLEAWINRWSEKDFPT